MDVSSLCARGHVCSCTAQLIIMHVFGDVGLCEEADESKQIDSLSFKIRSHTIQVSAVDNKAS